MKKLWVLACAAGLLVAVPVRAAYDGQIKLETSGGYGNADGGGVFSFKVVSGLPGLITDGTHHFQSFCLEYNEHISWGGTYNVHISQTETAVLGGYAPPGDPLSEGTAWLYSQFRAGTLANYNNDAASANALQQAIWWLEQESRGSDQGLAATFLQEARTALGISDNATMRTVNATYGQFGVVVLNLYDANGGYAQDQLGIVPEPTTLIAGAVLMLPLGTSILRSIRRHKT
jgi:hypothetical protein